MKKLRYILDYIIDFLFPLGDEECFIANLEISELAKHTHVNTVKGVGVTLFRYKDPLIRRMVWLLKYRRNQNVANLFASIMSEYITETLGDAYLFENFEKPWLIPMPLSRKRAQERGFNQTELLADAIYEQSGDFLVLKKGALKKIRETKPQTKLTRKERLINLKDSFKAQSDIVSGKNIILIDDVITTGSTMKEARRALRHAGAKKVLCIAVAS